VIPPSQKMHLLFGSSHQYIVCLRLPRRIDSKKRSIICLRSSTPHCVRSTGAWNKTTPSARGNFAMFVLCCCDCICTTFFFLIFPPKIGSLKSIYGDSQQKSFPTAYSSIVSWNLWRLGNGHYVCITRRTELSVC